MFDFLMMPLSFQIFGIAGSIIAVIGSLIAAIAYRGKQGQMYSPLNHFISELGEVGVSRLAWVFNLGLILTGLCLVVAVLGLGLMLPGWLSNVALVAGVVCALGLSFVGFFPMNQLTPHTRAAMTFFRGGLVMVILFSLAIGFQSPAKSVISPWYALAGLPAIAAFSAFLVLIAKATQHTDEPLGTEEVTRPRIRVLAVVEWSIFLTILLWFLLIAVGLPAWASA